MNPSFDPDIMSVITSVNPSLDPGSKPLLVPGVDQSFVTHVCP